jgi:hypothetical protein
MEILTLAFLVLPIMLLLTKELLMGNSAHILLTMEFKVRFQAIVDIIKTLITTVLGSLEIQRL